VQLKLLQIYYENLSIAEKKDAKLTNIKNGKLFLLNLLLIQFFHYLQQILVQLKTKIGIKISIIKLKKIINLKIIN
jgi:hypothetical protein